jgi:hypothetical protein
MMRSNYIKNRMKMENSTMMTNSPVKKVNLTRTKTSFKAMIKNHSHWHLKDNGNFTQTFYKNQKECPQSSNGKQICMKFFIQGICTRSCPRSHPLMKEDEKKFKSFLLRCRVGASKPDF